MSIWGLFGERWGMREVVIIALALIMWLGTTYLVLPLLRAMSLGNDWNADGYAVLFGIYVLASLQAPARLVIFILIAAWRVKYDFDLTMVTALQVVILLTIVVALVYCMDFSTWKAFLANGMVWAINVIIPTYLQMPEKSREIPRGSY